MAPASRSRSGVRISGDDFQHLVTLNEVLLALRPNSDVRAITVEAPETGNLDDIVIERDGGLRDFIQVKHAVDAATPVGAEWLFSKSKPQSPSLLQRMHQSWRPLRDNHAIGSMQFVTDREVDSRDPVLKCLDRHTELLVPAIRSLKSEQLMPWLDHLGVETEELFEFLAKLQLRTGRPHASEVERAQTLLWALGIETNQASIDSGLALIREWVQQRERTYDVDELRTMVEGRLRRASELGGLLVIEGITEDPHPEDADIVLHFVDLYDGDDPNLRRSLVDQGHWDDTVGPALAGAADQFNAIGYRRVSVRGAMRLPLWFGAGAALRDVSGFTVSALQHGELWTSESSAPVPDLQIRRRELDAGGDLAIAVGIAADPEIAVWKYLKVAGLPVDQLAVMLPRSGVGPNSIADGSAAAGIAVAIRDQARVLLEERPADLIHLFLAVPGGLALLLGHRWNALRPTTVYEHLGVGRGYQPTLRVNA